MNIIIKPDTLIASRTSRMFVGRWAVLLELLGGGVAGEMRAAAAGFLVGSDHMVSERSINLQ